jgi:hypothetical protein
MRSERLGGAQNVFQFMRLGVGQLVPVRHSRQFLARNTVSTRRVAQSSMVACNTDRRFCPLVEEVPAYVVKPPQFEH